MASRKTSRAPAAGPDRASFEVAAPTRVDLAGGTLDLWPLSCLHPGSMTVNVALAYAVRLRMVPGGAAAARIGFVAPGRRPLLLEPEDAARHLAAAVGFHLCPKGGFTVEVLEQPPVGSGLGASSAFAVALARGCLALSGRRMRRAALVAVLRDLEARVLGVPTGVQDYVSALAGGVLALHLEPGGERVERLAVAPDWVAARLVVMFSGITHASGMVNWEVVRGRLDGAPGVARGLDAIAGAARACRQALLAADERGVGRAVAAEWDARRRLAASVTNAQVDAVLTAGVAAGAYAGKACGAGGGGSVLFWAPPALRTRVGAAAMSAAPAGAFEIDAAVRRRGATVRRGRATMAARRG